MNFVPLVEPARAEPKLEGVSASGSPSSNATIKALEPKKDPTIAAAAGRAARPS